MAVEPGPEASVYATISLIKTEHSISPNLLLRQEIDRPPRLIV